MSELLERIRSDLKSDAYYSQNFPNEGQQFLAWYLRNCYLRTAVQAKDDITDGPNDKEFDGIIVDDEWRRKALDWLLNCDTAIAVPALPTDAPAPPK